MRIRKKTNPTKEYKGYKIKVIGTVDSSCGFIKEILLHFSVSLVIIFRVNNESNQWSISIKDKYLLIMMLCLLSLFSTLKPGVPDVISMGKLYKKNFYLVPGR